MSENNSSIYIMLVQLHKKTSASVTEYYTSPLTTRSIIHVMGVCFDGIVLRCDQSSHYWANQMSACILTPLCEGHSEALRWLVEGPELGVPPFSLGLMGSVGVLSVVCPMRFEVLCRSTKAGPSAPGVSPPSSLRRWTGLHRKKAWWTKFAKSRGNQVWYEHRRGGSWGGRHESMSQDDNMR